MTSFDPNRVRELLAEKKSEIEAQEMVVGLLQGLLDEAERDLNRLIVSRKGMFEHPDVQKALADGA